MDWRYITGTATIVLIVGGTIYAIKKSLDKDKLEEDIITVEEALAEVHARRAKETKVDEALDSDEFGELVDDVRDHASYNRSFMPDDEDGEENNEEDEEETIHFTVPLTEEDKTLRHEPSSIDARKQYIRMELAEWTPNEVAYQTLNRLFDFPFNPKNDGDHDLKTHIIDYRVKFFGFGSKWAQEVTFAEVILHYARLANYNCDETIKYWAEYFLEFNELYYNMSSYDIDDIIESLNDHVYFNEENGTFGLFGLTTVQMNQAIAIADRNIDNSVTYEIEFNEFLKGCI